MASVHARGTRGRVMRARRAAFLAGPSGTSATLAGRYWIAGRFRLEGKDYVVADGDVLHYRFAN